MANTEFIIGMRDAYFTRLYEIFKEDKKAVFVTADAGAPTLDRFASDFPDQYYTVGIAEQQLIGLAAGLAVEGRKVYVYAITPFVTLRCIEFIKLDICAANLPIVLLGVGSGYSYDVMGPTHHAVEDLAMMRVLPNLKIYNFSDARSAISLVEQIHYDNSPQYVRFDRSGLSDLNTSIVIETEKGMRCLKRGRNIGLISTGIMTHTALKVANLLREFNIHVAVLDVFTIKPFNVSEFRRFIDANDIHNVVTLEENLLAGGFGSLILEEVNDKQINGIKILRIGQDDKFVFDMGGREAIWKKYGLDAQSISQRILKFLLKDIV